MVSARVRFALGSLVFALFALPLASAQDEPEPDICQVIASKISNASAVFYSPSPEYTKDISHWASSSDWPGGARCSVEPATVDDVVQVIKTVGDEDIGTFFAIKSGGHASNPGYSSTPGVQIALSRFNKVVYNKHDQTATIGAGLVWDDVYAALAPHGVNVLGGRVSGVGVGGFLLGGGYSWLANQHGLAVDTIVEYQIVTPQGIPRTVTAADTDLFWALKGGGNRFGIVTHFTMKTFPQGLVWGGHLIFSGDKYDALMNATLAFNTQTHKKAQIITTLNVQDGVPSAVVLLFYDGVLPPPGLFDTFLKIPAAAKDIRTRSFLSMVQGIPDVPVSRAIFNTVTLPDITADLLATVVNETLTQGKALAASKGAFVSYDIEPFVKGYLNNPARTSDSAFPADRTVHGVPLNIYYSWQSDEDDDTFHDAIIESASNIQTVAGRPALPRYPNYAISSTLIATLFGQAGVNRLVNISKTLDPDGNMNLAGGFRFIGING